MLALDGDDAGPAEATAQQGVSTSWGPSCRPAAVTGLRHYPYIAAHNAMLSCASRKRRMHCFWPCSWPMFVRDVGVGPCCRARDLGASLPSRIPAPECLQHSRSRPACITSIICKSLEFCVGGFHGHAGACLRPWARAARACTAGGWRCPKCLARQGFQPTHLAAGTVDGQRGHHVVQ